MHRPPVEVTNNTADEILIKQMYVTQEILNAKEKEFQSWRSENLMILKTIVKP